MMGDSGTYPNLLYPTLGVQEREEFHVQAPGSTLEPSEPSSSNNLDDQHPLFLPSLDHHPAVSFRPAGFEAWSNRDFEGVSVGARNCAQDPIQNRPSDPEDTLDVMARARVGEDDLFTFPEGETDAVTITARDLASLQPGKFLTDNTVDFYLKYLKVKAISPEHQNRFHFFNSFFFRKLLETTASTGVDEYRVDYLQLRKWVADVHLFEKDFVFVPISARSHWSLLVICHLRSLNPSSRGEKKGSPCILHLDPIEGKHEAFEGQVKSFILQAWLERFEASKNLDILHSLFQMKYEAKVPQQGNGYDCGLYILHYIEVFLSKSLLQELIVSSFEGVAHFTWPNFRVEVLDKRNSIRHIIFQLSGMSASCDGNYLSIQPMPQEEDGLVHLGHQHQRLPKVVKEMKSKKWKEIETTVLLQCVVGGGHFNKGKLGAMHWDLIAEEINSKNNGGPLRSREQCQNRFDTLLKAFKDLNAYCLRMDKEFHQVSEGEKRSLKLATPLGEEHEEWYNHLRIICDRRSSLRDQSHKRRKPNVYGDMDANKLASSPIHSSSQRPLPLDGIGSSKSMKPSSRQVVLRAFNEMEQALKYTFLNLIQVWLLETLYLEEDIEGYWSLEYLCRMLGAIQDQNPLKVWNHIYKLQDLKLVTLSYMEWHEGFFRDCWMNKIWVEISDFEVYKQFGWKVLSKNPHLNTFLRLSHIDGSNTHMYLLQKIRVLNFYKCSDLEILDLENFPHLCCFFVIECHNLKVVNGWEASKGLVWIEIWKCPSYCNLPDLQFLSSLKEFYFGECGMQRIPWQVANFSHCVQLRRLEIDKDNDLVESMDLKALRVLEVLSFSRCKFLSTIHGLSGLASLMKLKVHGCDNLKVIPDLGCLKALTHLDLSCSGIIEILGLEELHLLTTLDLTCCESLESLPHLGHLKALAFVDLCGSSIEEIPGVEDLVSLEILWCSRSKLKQLPNLEHLRRLRSICVRDAPLFGVDPSRSFIGGYEVIHNDRKKEGLFLDDFSDTNDSHVISFDEK